MASESVSGPHPKVDPTREYTSRSAGHRKREDSRGLSISVLRVIYFGLAATWGFLTGVAGLLAALSLAGTPVFPNSAVLFGLVPALGLALVGGWVLSRAYYDSKQRRRR